MAKDQPNRSLNLGNDLTFDSELSRALHSVPVPSGLANKLVEHVRHRATTDDEDVSPAERQGAAPALRSLANSTSIESEPHAADSISAQSEQVAPQAEGGRLGSRWRQLAISISLGSAALLVLAVFYFNQKLNTEQLADHCLAELEQLEEQSELHADWKAESPSADFWNSLKPVRRARSAHIVGSRQLTSSRFGDGVVWKLTADNQIFYVFEFRSPRIVKDLTQHLTVIRRQSGRWSLASCRNQDKIIVIACKGEIAIRVYSA